MKINIKRTVFIVICAELLLMYWTHMELRETRKREIVYSKQHNGSALRTEKAGLDVSASASNKGM